MTMLAFALGVVMAASQMDVRMSVMIVICLSFLIGLRVNVFPRVFE
jgi:hypothetical protein